MTKFFWKTLLLLLLLLASFGFIYLLPTDRSAYLNASIVKLNRLKSTSPPRVIFVGGSNLAFGLDSQVVEKQLGRHVVNMGLEAGQGLRFMLEQTKANLREGDLVVVVPEYEQFSATLNGERDLADLVVLAPGNLAYISSPKQLIVLLKNLPLPFQDKVNRRIVAALHGAPPSSEIYRADKFNVYGDLTSHLGRPPKTDWQSRDILPGTFKPTISDEAITLLNGFQNYAENRGAHVTVIFPCLSEPLNAEERRHLDAIYQRLKAETKLNIVSNPEKYIYPLACFFDSRYHLTTECRETRTREILSDLRQAHFD